MNRSFPKVQEIVRCEVCNRGILEFYVPPFSNGMVKEYCPICDGKEKRAPKKFTAEISWTDISRPKKDRGPAYCLDCGKGLPVGKRGMKRRRCVRHTAIHSALRQQIQRKALRERWMPMVDEIRNKLRSA